MVRSKAQAMSIQDMRKSLKTMTSSVEGWQDQQADRLASAADGGDEDSLDSCNQRLEILDEVKHLLQEVTNQFEEWPAA